MRVNISPIDQLSICPLSSVRCAQSYHVVASRQPSIWRRSEAWSRSAFDSRRTRCVSTDSQGLISLDKREMFAAEVIC